MAKTTFTPEESKDERTQARAALDHHRALAADAATDLFSEVAQEYAAYRKSLLRENRTRRPFGKNRKIMLDRDIGRLAEYHGRTVSEMTKDIDAALRGEDA